MIRPETINGSREGMSVIPGLEDEAFVSFRNQLCFQGGARDIRNVLQTFVPIAIVEPRLNSPPVRQGRRKQPE
jgi:hypothetical protein